MTCAGRSAWNRPLVLVALAVGGLLSTGCGNSEEAVDTPPKAQVEGQTTLRNGQAGSASTPSVSSGAASAPSGITTDPTLDAILRRAMEQERYSESTYRNILRKVGSRTPFVNIVESEVQHTETLEQLASKYGQDVGSTFVPGESAPDTMALACQLGAKIETETVSLYDGLLLRVAKYPDVAQVFQNLRSASADEHLPAFQNCAAGDQPITPKASQGSG